MSRSSGMLNVKIGFTSAVNAGEHPDRRPARRRADCNSLEAWLDRIERIHPKSIAMGLDRVAAVRYAMALDPTFPVIAVSGTNGKGSTCAMMEAILSAAGYRVGCYTSPHLLRFNERVRVSGVSASDECLASALARVDASRKEVTLTYFEFATLAAMRIFIDDDVDVAILEVGLGGRLDAVNVFDADCAVITSVAIDHIDYLGPTRETIAFEKAGIFRPRMPAVCSEPDVPESMLSHAQAIGARLLRLDEAFAYEANDDRWTYRSANVRLMDLPKPHLKGAFQLRNASAAITALQAVADGGLRVAPRHIAQGISEARLPGRFHVLRERPEVVVDVAHNRQAAEALRDNLGSTRKFRRTLAVFAMLDDKDVAAVIEATKSSVADWFIADIRTERGATAERLRGELTQSGVAGERVFSFDSPERAYRAAMKQAAEDDRVVVFGSFHTVAAAMTVHRDEALRSE